GYDNVIYEICNEPNGGVNWPTIKNYAEQVIPVIKKNNPDAIIIVGTPTWSQEVDKAAADPITGYTNIMYTLHFYAATHKDSLRKTMQNAINSGLPIFVTEFGTCDASGSGGNDFNSANAWVELMDKNSVSYCIWSLCNKNETAALINSGCSKTSGWSESDLSDAGKWYVGVLNNGVPLGSLDINDSSQSSQPSDNSNNSSSSEPAASSSSGNTGVTLTQSNHWNDGKADFYQYVVNVKNTSSSKISGWSVTVSFGGNVSIDQSWSGNITASGNTVSIKPQDFNSSLAAGESVEVGFIVKTNESLGTPAVTVGN
ncbi:MAG: cellulase family glycosylhydrolase, partial [Lachnospiraceae bacterium]|nr:cellulase family glycosylhydrolase [Lachnospiraceae bacterium]